MVHENREAPRALHIADALAVTDFDCRIPRAAVRGLTVHHGGARLTYAVANRYFAAMRCAVDGVWEQKSDPDTFVLFTGLLRTYLGNNADKTDYPAYKRAGYFVGSGAIESASPAFAPCKGREQSLGAVR